MPTPFELCLVTAADAKTTRLLARGLVGRRLAACVTELPGARSTYGWKGRLETARERLLLIKTRRALRKAVTAFVAENHPYENPEIIFLPVSAGARPYLEWLLAGTAPTKKNKDKRK